MEQYVAVDDASRMRRLQSIRSLNGHGQEPLNRERLLVHQLRQRLPFEQFHHQEMLALN